MKEFQSVFTSDALNLNMVKLTTGCLLRALADQWDIGIPAHLSHDLTRLIGWARPTMVYFEPGLTRLAGINLIPENESEMREIREAQLAHVNSKIKETCEPGRVSELKARIKEYLNSNEVPAGLTSVSLCRDGLAKDVFRSIFEQADKDGLVPTSLLNYVGMGIFESNGLLLFAHPWFRRSNNKLNSLNTTFIDRFFETLKNHRSQGAIALDPDLIGLAGTQIEHLEHEYWWGPKFSDDLSKIPPGVTRHQAEEYERRGGRTQRHAYSHEHIRDLSLSIRAQHRR
jgi:hypothetical protein